MGAWGNEPLESDAALDWLGSLTDKISVDLRKVVETFDNEGGNYETTGDMLRAAADVVIRVPHFGGARSTLERDLADRLVCLKASSWPDNYNDSAAVRESIDRQVLALRESQTTSLSNYLAAAPVA